MVNDARLRPAEISIGEPLVFDSSDPWDGAARKGPVG